jgi:hypothetical protein
MQETDPQEPVFDAAGAHLVRLLRRGATERPFGSLTVTYSWKAGLLTKRVVNESEETILVRPPSAAN